MTETLNLPSRAELEARVERVINDSARLAALRQTALMDSPAEEAFDRLTRLACLILDAPVALVSLVDNERHFFKSHCGLPEPWATRRERPLAETFCHYTVALGHPFVIGDASADPFVGDNSATVEFGIRGYMGMPLMTSEGHGLGDFCVLDTRPREWTEEQLSALKDLAASAMTEIEVRTLAREAEERAREAEAAVRAREEILAIVSHDLRSPLNSIVMGADLLLEERLSESDRDKQTGVIRRSAHRMQRLIQDLLDVSKMEGGHFGLELEPVDAGTLVREAIECCLPSARKKSLQVETSATDSAGNVRADSDHALRVIVNLLDNAIKFTPEGGRITASAERSEDEVCFSVSDTGPGIPEDHRPHLFDSYWQASRTARQGAGLGLPICKGIVEAHGGRIWAESEIGRGSTLRFTLPTADERARPRR